MLLITLRNFVVILKNVLLFSTIYLLPRFASSLMDRKIKQKGKVFPFTVLEIEPFAVLFWALGIVLYGIYCKR